MSIVANAGCPVDAATMREIGRQLIQNNPGNFPCDTSNCPRTWPSITVSRAACWKQVFNTYEPCRTADQGCADVFEVCCQCDSTITAFYKFSTSSDQCETGSGPECKTTCALSGTPETTVCPGAVAAPAKTDPLR